MKNKPKMRKIISQDDYLASKGLYHLARDHYRKYNEYQLALATLLGYDEDDDIGYMGHISDNLYEDNLSLEKGMEAEGIFVEGAATTFEAMQRALNTKEEK